MSTGTYIQYISSILVYVYRVDQYILYIPAHIYCIYIYTSTQYTVYIYIYTGVYHSTSPRPLASSTAVCGDNIFISTMVNSNTSIASTSNV